MRQVAWCIPLVWWINYEARRRNALDGILRCWLSRILCDFRFLLPLPDVMFLLVATHLPITLIFHHKNCRFLNKFSNNFFFNFKNSDHYSSGFGVVVKINWSKFMQLRLSDKYLSMQSSGINSIQHSCMVSNIGQLHF